MTSNQVFDELLTWVAGFGDSPPDLAKYTCLNNYLLANGVRAREGGDHSYRAIAVVLGGGEAVIEQSVLQDVGFSRGDVICIDRVAPLESPFLGENSIVWLKGLFPDIVGEDDIPPADLLVCLGASRYFPDAFDTYRRVVGRLRPGALVVIDFFNLPVIRRGAIEALREWVFMEWVRDRDSTMAALKDMARISVNIGQQLAGSTVSLESSCPPLGVHSGIWSTQRVLFEVFFPFSFKSGIDEEEVLAQIVWHLLCYSVEGNQERVLAFADSCAIDVIGVLALTPDTNVLVGRMASS